MKIYIDADACPKAIKEILIKAAIRTQRELILVANKPLNVLRHALIKTVLVPGGFDVADDYIADVVEPHDLVITADIPLADKVIDKHAVALNPRGTLYTKENIKQRLSVRNFNEVLRSTGIQTGGPKIMSKQDIQKFANALDRYLAISK
ncbi:MAG: YaiI/YqxD family protein [Gammaproteobacteria bacterium]|nr:YaiI/YqxD family protein [Gammaproteobacteria bacterium]